MNIIRAGGWLLACLLLSASARADVLTPQRAETTHEEEARKRVVQELEVRFPVAPVETQLVDFYVSAASPHRFAVDPVSVSVGKDGIVRYTLVVLTRSGARNVTYEGMRCSTRERRTYGIGQRDGSWSRSRAENWVKITEADVNRQYAALFQDYFCPGGVIVPDAGEAIRLLKMGGGQLSVVPGR